jgi:general secretion pathway protein D
VQDVYNAVYVRGDVVGETLFYGRGAGPDATASAVLNDSRTRVLHNPQVRVTDGQTAKLRIGARIPYATGSFLPSMGGVTTGTGGGFGLLASTQFQYQEVGVNLDLTPRLMANGEVNLHARIEISSVGADRTVGGFAQPTFNQRVIEHDIRLKEGEVNLLGGLIETKESQSVSGLPGLSQIPLLGYLFSSQHRERVETEVLVMLTPRVIRLPERLAESGREVPVGVGAAAPAVPTPPAPEPTPQPESPPEQPGQPQ